MSLFLDACAAFIDTQPFQVIRISEMTADDKIETLERMKVSSCQNIYSGAKAYTMTAVGILCDRGALDVNERFCDIMKNDLPAGMDPRWETVTVDMLLRHRAGLPGGFLDIDCNPSPDFTADFLKFTLQTPLCYTPDEEERYSDGAYYLLSRVVAKKSGMGLEDLLWQALLEPMGVQEMAFSHCPQGYAVGATGMYIHSSDFVKLGWLYLNGGMFRGRRVLSEQWVRTALERAYTFEWDDTHTLFFKGGMHGQKLMASPRQHRAVALQAFGANSNVVADWVKRWED
ncbi:MAG: beta-lactamase family protein [Clostridia bacterium]|nr:beta-lactamase family protein [Clostridia bacterium]